MRQNISLNEKKTDELLPTSREPEMPMPQARTSNFRESVNCNEAPYTTIRAYYQLLEPIAIVEVKYPVSTRLSATLCGLYD
jgi:hypothetical protein